MEVRVVAEDLVKEVVVEAGEDLVEIVVAVPVMVAKETVEVSEVAPGAASEVAGVVIVGAEVPLVVVVVDAVAAGAECLAARKSLLNPIVMRAFLLRKERKTPL